MMPMTHHFFSEQSSDAVAKKRAIAFGVVTLVLFTLISLAWLLRAKGIELDWEVAGYSVGQWTCPTLSGFAGTSGSVTSSDCQGIAGSRTALLVETLIWPLVLMVINSLICMRLDARAWLSIAPCGIMLLASLIGVSIGLTVLLPLVIWSILLLFVPILIQEILGYPTPLRIAA